MSDLNKDLKDLLDAARTAIDVLRNNAERLEIQGQDNSPERNAIKRLNMAIQLIEYDLYTSGELDERWDWRL